MAKKNNINLILFLSGCLLLMLGWLMKSFPLFIFFGLAPLIAIASNNRTTKAPWNSIELVLVALGVGYFSNTFFELENLVIVIVQAIAFAFVFLAFTALRKTIGENVNLMTLLLFWLGLEYVLLKIAPDQFIYLADALQLKPEWSKWSSKTGYLGTSLWILTSNLLLYKAILAHKKVNWIYLASFILSISLPIWYSFSLSSRGVNREEMIALYSHSNLDSLPLAYVESGEFIPRTSAWVSVLIILFGIVKYKIKRK